MDVVIGGNRIGSGKKMHTELHNYNRSTHNLSDTFTSTMAPGVLYPCFVKLGLRKDVFEINLNADCRTIPTKGPLFGSYKMQIDFYQCPVRLYQALLHNNATKLGLNMNKVKFPKITCTTFTDGWGEDKNGKFATNCLMSYLGTKGIGQAEDKNNYNSTITRDFNAIPVLAYYDIFKNYYANKQEDKAWVITGNKTSFVSYELVNYNAGQHSCISIEDEEQNTNTYGIYGNMWFDCFDKNYSRQILLIYRKRLGEGDNAPNETIVNKWPIELRSSTGLVLKTTIGDLKTYANGTGITYDYRSYSTYGALTITIALQKDWKYNNYIINDIKIQGAYTIEETNEMILQDFDLQNIDDMRYDILSFHTLGSSFKITDTSKLPYKLNAETRSNGITKNSIPMNGLVVKTYQNDIFNNWLNTDWIEGENGINEMTKVAVVDGKFSMDALNFSTKLYNMLNRVAVTDGTYESYQDVVWEPIARRAIESPVYCGGMSKEVVFDEVVQTAPGEYNGNENPLGTLGGRGRSENNSQKGGHLIIKCEEACFIIGIVSLTPRIKYSQGNEFYMTELDSFDDLHKPAMDGIGFQDLIGERMAWWDTHIDGSTITHRSKIGKSPAWIDYMTSVDRVFGDFAEAIDVEDEKNVSYMTLNRNYEEDETTGGIKDATTYIDPQKYNYAFAWTALEAQNFWLEIAFNTKVRRLMSARIIPNV